MIGRAQRSLDPREVGMAVLVPVGHDGERVGAGRAPRSSTPRTRRASPSRRLRLVHRDGIVRDDRRAGREQLLDQRQRRRLAHVVRVRLERQSPHRDARPATDRRRARADSFANMPVLLIVVHRFDRFENPADTSIRRAPSSRAPSRPSGSTSRRSPGPGTGTPVRCGRRCRCPCARGRRSRRRARRDSRCRS